MVEIQIKNKRFPIEIKKLKKLLRGERLAHFRRMLAKSQALYSYTHVTEKNTYLTLSAVFIENMCLCPLSDSHTIIHVDVNDGKYCVDASNIVVTSGVSICLFLHHG